MDQTIADWTPAQLRQFIVNSVLTDPAAVPAKKKELPASPPNMGMLGMLRGAGPNWLRGAQQVGSVRLDVDSVNMKIDNIPQDGNHLLIVWHARITDATLVSSFSMRLSGDAGANYYDTEFDFIGGTIAAHAIPTTTSARVGRVPGSTSTAGAWAGGFVFMPGYSTVGASHPYMALCSSLEGSPAAQVGEVDFGTWFASPINSVEFFANFTAASTMNAYVF